MSSPPVQLTGWGSWECWDASSLGLWRCNRSPSPGPEEDDGNDDEFNDGYDYGNDDNVDDDDDNDVEYEDVEYRVWQEKIPHVQIL